MVPTKFKDGRVHYRNSGMKGLRERGTASGVTDLLQYGFSHSENGSTLKGKLIMGCQDPERTGSFSEGTYK